MKTNLKKIMAVILAAIVVMTTFAACSKNKDKGEGAPADETVNATENSTEPTSEEGWSENTTKKDGEESTSASVSSSTTEGTTKKETTTAKKETTTKTYHNNNNSNSAKPTTTKKHTTTTQKPVTTKPNKPNETTEWVPSIPMPPEPSKNPKPLTDAQKKEFVDGYFGQFPKHGAKPGFKYEDCGPYDPDHGYSAEYHTGVTVDQGNYKEMLKYYLNNAINYDSKKLQEGGLSLD